MPYRIVRPRRSLVVVQDSFVDNGQERVAAVYRDQAQRMWRALFSFAGDPDIASDAMAEAFARALRDRGTIRDLTAWTWRVAFRIAASELRRRHTTTASFEDSSYELPEPVPELLMAFETALAESTRRGHPARLRRPANGGGRRRARLFARHGVCAPQPRTSSPDETLGRPR